MAMTAVDLLGVREAAEARRSIRAYQPEPVPTEDLTDILDVVRLAPSAFNLQPWRFVVVETPELKQRLAKAAYDQRQVHSAPAVIVLYTDVADALEYVDEVVHPGMDEDKQASTREYIRRTFGAQTDQERETWGMGQGYIALGYLLLAAEAHGYQTSPMTGFKPEEVKELLGLPAHVKIPALIAIGRGAETGFPKHRHDLERIARAA